MKYLVLTLILITSFIWLKPSTYYPYQTTYDINGKLYNVKELGVIEFGPYLITFTGNNLNKSFRIIGKPYIKSGSWFYKIKGGSIIQGHHKITLRFSHTTIIYHY